jgi:hypothetical protein
MRSKLRLVAFTLLGSWMGVAFLGCGDTTASTTDAGVNEGTDGSSSTDATQLDATTTDSADAPSADGGLPVDADAAPGADAADATPTDAAVGWPLDPGKITCGATTCSTPADICCIESDSGACQPSVSSTCNGLRVACDETSDCAPGQNCCIVTNDIVPAVGPPMSTTAGYTCSPASCAQYGYMIHRVTFQACKTSADCKSPDTCVVQTCGGREFQTCGNIDPKACR